MLPSKNNWISKIKISPKVCKNHWLATRKCFLHHHQQVWPALLYLSQIFSCCRQHNDVSLNTQRRSLSKSWSLWGRRGSEAWLLPSHSPLWFGRIKGLLLMDITHHSDSQTLGNANEEPHLCLQKHSPICQGHPSICSHPNTSCWPYKAQNQRIILCVEVIPRCFTYTSTTACPTQHHHLCYYLWAIDGSWRPCYNFACSESMKNMEI